VKREKRNKKNFIKEIFDPHKLRLLIRLLSYKSSYFFSLIPPHPLNLTISLDYRCNSRCLTCNIWEKNCIPLSPDEYENIFRSFKSDILWVTFSGGEPFLREDLTDICKSFYSLCSPSFINIPTNGILCERIPSMVEQIARACPGAAIIINLSLDQWGEKHDRIRQVPGNFNKALNTYSALQHLKLPNLTLGIHTVLSKYNVRDFGSFYWKLKDLAPHSYIVEMAEERFELDTINSDITPSPEEYSPLVDFLIDEMERGEYPKVSALTQAFRRVYYELSREVLLQKRQVIPCYSGFISAHIYPDGSVYPCCITGDSFGNLRDVDYRFSEIWTGEKAEKIRLNIKNGKCYCPLANSAYTSIMCNPFLALKVMWYYLKISLKKE